MQNPQPKSILSCFSSAAVALIVVIMLSAPVRSWASETSSETENLFQSRLILDEKGKPDLSVFSQCQPQSDQRLSEGVVKDSKQHKKPAAQKTQRWQLNYQSAPEISSQRVHLKGDVSVRDASSLILADEVIINKQSQLLDASGGVSVESLDGIFTADSLNQDRTDGKTSLENANFYLFDNHANGQAESITLKANKKAQLKTLNFTTCPVNQVSWQLSTSKMFLDQNRGRGEAWNTILRVKDIPVFYLPYLSFPIDDRRKSGLLSPSFKNSDKNGLDARMPIYWNIAPSMDATLLPRNIEKRGVQLGGEFRWLTGKTFSQLNFEHMDNDKLVSLALAGDGSVPMTAADSSERWLASLKHQASYNRNWQLSLDLNRVSDASYPQDFGAGLERSNRTQLSSRADLRYQDDVWSFELFSLSHQSLIGNESYRYLPGIRLAAEHLDDSGFRWQLDSEWSRFEHKDPTQVDASRVNIKPSLSYPIEASWGFVKPELSYQSTRYQQKSPLDGKESNITRHLPIASLDAGLHFERASQWFGEQYTQLLSPRVFYTYIPYREQAGIGMFDSSAADFNFDQLWRENRFNGIDRVGDTNHLSLALGNAWFKDKNGDRVLSFELGRRYYLKDRQVQLGDSQLKDSQPDDVSSPWLGQLSLHLSKSLSFNGFIEWESGAEKTNQALAQIKFEPRANHIVNLSHRYRDIAGQTVEEADFSFAWPLNDNWRLVGRWYNDRLRHQNLETLFGVEYESCCWALRLVTQKYLNTQLDATGAAITIGDQYSEGIHFQFVFKGLGSAGQADMNKSLESSIRGYRDRFSAQN